MSEKQKLPKETIIHLTNNLPFSIHHTVVESGEKSALYLHCHPEAEFFYLASGQVRFFVENRSYDLEAGDAVFIPPSLLHSAETLTPSGSSTDFHALVFSMELLEQYPHAASSYFAPLYRDRMECICHISGREPAYAGLLQRLCELWPCQGTDPQTFELTVIGTLFQCWQILHNTRLSGGNALPPAQHFAAGLSKSQEYMQTHFDEEITLDRLARVSGYSQSYFCHRFKAYTGYTPFEYLNRVRIIKSCDYLADTGKKIAEVATLCGFNDVSYYNRVFTKVMGVTPSAYRIANR